MENRENNVSGNTEEPYWMHMAKLHDWVPPKDPDSAFDWKIFFVVMLPFALLIIYALRTWLPG